MTSATTKQVYVMHDFLHIKFMLCMILADFTLLMLENISHLLSFIYVIGWHYIILKSLGNQNENVALATLTRI